MRCCYEKRALCVGGLLLGQEHLLLWTRTLPSTWTEEAKETWQSHLVGGLLISAGSEGAKAAGGVGQSLGEWMEGHLLMGQPLSSLMMSPSSDSELFVGKGGAGRFSTCKWPSGSSAAGHVTLRKVEGCGSVKGAAKSPRGAED